MPDKILVIGSSGQIGTELVISLREMYGNQNVIAADIRQSSKEIMNSGPFEELDVMNEKLLRKIIKHYKITQVYLLAALLSAKAEKDISLGWKLNMRSHSHVLDLAKDKLIKKIFWPSSIAVFGPTTPKNKTPQYTIMEPNTVYGITKLAGERWNEYYFNKYNVDIRSLRYPGLVGWESMPGGGTTDYAVDIFHEAFKHQKYTCFLSQNRILPMMYMDDAIKATINIMQAPSEKIKIRTSYNLSSLNFSPRELENEIKKHFPKFKMEYEPDERDQLAKDWPESINDDCAREDWGWKPNFHLSQMVSDIILNLTYRYKKDKNKCKT